MWRIWRAKIRNRVNTNHCIMFLAKGRRRRRRESGGRLTEAGSQKAEAMNVITPAIPKRLTVTQTMMEDFLCDPVLAAKVILGLDLDAFQRCRLRYMWWIPELIDCSGFSSGKTIVDWAYIQLRCILIPE